MRELKSFRARLESAGHKLGWTIVRIPFDVAKVWGKRGQMRVKGDINGFAFHTSLFPDGQGHHAMLVNKAMQKGGNVSVGSTAQFQLEPDTEKRVATMPPELKRALAGERTLQRWYEQLSNSMRVYFARLIEEIKSPEARQRRADRLAEQFFAAM